jgi:hypothetical protein
VLDPRQVRRRRAAVRAPLRGLRRSRSRVSGLGGRFDGGFNLLHVLQTQLKLSIGRLSARPR